MKTTYEVYAEWCEAHGHAVPTREAFYTVMAALPFAETIIRRNRDAELDRLEIEREKREGWGR